MIAKNVKLSPKEIERTILSDEQFAAKVSLEKDNIKHYLSKLFKTGESDVESLASKALQNAIAKYKNYNGIDGLETWLYGIVTNVAIDQIKANRKALA